MTDISGCDNSRKRASRTGALISISLILLSAALSVVFAKRISHSVKSALLLLSNVIIPLSSLL